MSKALKPWTVKLRQVSLIIVPNCFILFAVDCCATCPLEIVALCLPWERVVTIAILHETLQGPSDLLRCLNQMQNAHCFHLIWACHPSWPFVLNFKTLWHAKAPYDLLAWDTHASRPHLAYATAFKLWARGMWSCLTIWYRTTLAIRGWQLLIRAIPSLAGFGATQVDGVSHMMFQQRFVNLNIMLLWHRLSCYCLVPIVLCIILKFERHTVLNA